MCIAIVYSTKYGFTKEAVEYFRTKIKYNVELIDINDKKIIDLKKYKKIIIGGPIFIGNLEKKIKNFLKQNKDEIAKKEFILFISAGVFDERYIDENIPKILIEKAKGIFHFGSAICKKRLNFLEKIILLIVGRYKEYKFINEDEMEKAAKIINS